MPSSSRHRLAPYLFVAPFVLTFLCFGLYPIVKSLYLSLFQTLGPGRKVLVGFGNFSFMLGDPEFYRAVWNTVVFALGSIFIQLPLSLGLALLLNRPDLRLRNLFRFGFFLPYLLGPVFVAVLFGVIFAPRYGLLNVFLHWALNMDLERKWLGDAGLVMPALILTAMWLYAGFNMIYFLAALQTVPHDLVDAARVDGAGAWQRFRHVTWPAIKPVAIFVVISSTIGSFQLFELPFMMLQGSGPEQAGLTIVMYLYEKGFVAGDLGYASAVGWTLALGVLVLSLCQLRVSGAWSRDGAG